MESEKQEPSKVMGRYGIQWKHLGSHNKHLFVLNYKKQEREKEVAKLEQAVSDEQAELSEIVSRQRAGNSSDQEGGRSNPAESIGTFREKCSAKAGNGRID